MAFKYRLKFVVDKDIIQFFFVSYRYRLKTLFRNKDKEAANQIITEEVLLRNLKHVVDLHSRSMR